MALPPGSCCANCKSWTTTTYNALLGTCRMTGWDNRGGHTRSTSRAKVQVIGPALEAVLETTADHYCGQWERT